MVKGLLEAGAPIDISVTPTLVFKERVSLMFGKGAVLPFEACQNYPPLCQGLSRLHPFTVCERYVRQYSIPSSLGTYD